MYPSGITRALVDLMAAQGRIVPYLDVPIQHGSDRILEAMRRPERRSTILERTGWLREAVPNLTLRTTVIVGFPGETEEDFQAMLRLLEEVRFERVGAFPYSVEEGTRAAELPNRVPEDVIAERLEEVMELQRDISFERNLAVVGSEATVLVDELLDGDDEFSAVGRCASQAIDVDGVTHLRAAQPPEPGSFVRVRVTDALDYDLLAEVIDGA
jgi:ribosomal protein S12 methylthiotransferase